MCLNLSKTELGGWVDPGSSVSPVPCHIVPHLLWGAALPSLCAGLMGLWVSLARALLAWPILDTLPPGHSHLSRVRHRTKLGQLEWFSGVLLVDTGRHSVFLDAMNPKLSADTSRSFSPLPPMWKKISVKREHEADIHRGDMIAGVLPILFQAPKTSKPVLTLNFSDTWTNKFHFLNL